MKKVLLVLIVVSFILISTCSCSNKTMGEMNATFSEFNNKTEIIKVDVGFLAYFYDHELSVKKLSYKGEEPKIIGVYNGEVYFQTVEHVGGIRFIYAYIGGSDNARVYKCDYYGENVAEVFIIEGFDSAPKFYCLDYTPGIIYMQSYETSSNEYIIEAYEIETGKFETICKGVKYDDYIENLYGEKARRAEIKSKLSEDVAKELLTATKEGRAFLEYEPYLDHQRVSFLNGRIFVSYHAPAGFSLTCLECTFEYCESANALNYYCYNFLGGYNDTQDFYLY